MDFGDDVNLRNVNRAIERKSSMEDPMVGRSPGLLVI